MNWFGCVPEVRERPGVFDEKQKRSQIISLFFQKFYKIFICIFDDMLYFCSLARTESFSCFS